MSAKTPAVDALLCQNAKLKAALAKQRRQDLKRRWRSKAPCDPSGCVIRAYEKDRLLYRWEWQKWLYERDTSPQDRQEILAKRQADRQEMRRYLSLGDYDYHFNTFPVAGPVGKLP